MKKLFLATGRGMSLKKWVVWFLVAGIIIAGGPPLPRPFELFSEQGRGLCFAEEAVASQKGISMDFQDVSLKQILKVFSQQSGMNFVASENVQDKRVTLFLDNVNIQDALNTILGANGLAFEQQPGTNVFIVKATGVSQIPLATKIYKLSYATVSGAEVGEVGGGGIEKVLEQLLTENGKIIVDSRTNSLLITDVPSSLTKIDQVLKELDVKTPQVMISAEILEVSVDTLRRIGVEWGSSAGNFLTYTGGSRSTYWPFKESLFKSATETNTAGTMSFTSFTAVLKAIKTDTNTQYLARPQLMTLNNKTAEMKITRNAAVASSTVTISEGGSPTTTTSLERYEVGTTLKVTPHINKDDYVTLTIEPEVSRVSEASFGSGYYDPLKRSSKTTVMVKDGETIVIAGLISREDSDANRKVPILGDVPIFGKIFNRDTNQKSNTEVLVFITTHIIKEAGAALATAMQQEFDYAGLATQAREGSLVSGESKLSKTRPGRLAREQDSPLSGRELMMETEVLKLRSAKMATN